MLKTIDRHITLVDFQTFLFPRCNCLWIQDDINCLIDNSPDQADLAYLRQQKIDLIINSHGHIDHYLYNHQFPRSKIMMHSEDTAIAQAREKYLEAFGMTTLNQDDRLQELYLKEVQYRTTRIDEHINADQVFNLGTTRFEVLHLPGHSPGHCGFIFPEQGFVFSADIDFSNFGPWYANLDSSIPQFLQSIDRLADLKPDYFISGHGAALVTENVSKRLMAYRDIIFARQRRIVDLLYRGYHSLEDLARRYPVYQRAPQPVAVFYIYEQVMILVHLRYLKEQGYVIQDDQGFYLKPGLSPARLSI